MQVAVVGCCHGELGAIYRKIQDCATLRLAKLLLICGDFQAIRNSADLDAMRCPPKYKVFGDFKDYYSGAKKAPILTVFIGGNHEASNHLWELYYAHRLMCSRYHGGWVCENIYFLGYSGVINILGLRIAGISGIFNESNYSTTYGPSPPCEFRQIKGPYHYRSFEVDRLKKLRSPVDVFLSHDWPREIYNFGDKARLLQMKPFFTKEVDTQTLGSRPLQELMGALVPRYWFSGHMHVKFDASIAWPTGTSTEFLALDKCLGRRHFIELLNITPTSKIADSRIALDREWVSIVRQSVVANDEHLFVPAWTGHSTTMAEAINRLVYGSHKRSNPESIDIEL